MREVSISTTENRIKQQSLTGMSLRILREIRNAKSILVAGANVVGIELMGEIVHAYPEKKLGLCLRGNRLLPVLTQKAHNLVHGFLQERNVQIHYNSPYDPNNYEFKDYEVVLQCTGYTFKTDYMKANFSQCIARSGEIYVMMSLTQPTCTRISLGPEWGVLNINGMASLGKKHGKAKFQFTDDFMKIMGGNHQLIAKGNKSLQGFKSFLSCMTCCCCCCSISNCFTITKKKK
eukprot:403343682